MRHTFTDLESSLSNLFAPGTFDSLRLMSARWEKEGIQIHVFQLQTFDLIDIYAD